MSRRSRRPIRLPVMWTLLAFFAVLTGFAAYFEVDQGVRAQGQVIPGSRTQVIQTLDGGILTTLNVREGDRVTAGQTLATLEPDRAEAGFEGSLAEVASNEIALVRARAELAGHAPRFNAQHNAWPNFVSAQVGIYRQRLRSLNEEVALLNASLQLAQEELAMNQRLQRSGDIAQSEVMRAQRQVFEVQSKITAASNTYLEETRAEIVELENNLAEAGYRLDERENVLRHTELMSPMDGVVKYVRISTVGGVLRAGDELMQISPVDDELLLEIKVNPSDVGQLRTGLPVTLRFDAFDSSIYGSVAGELIYVSPDTLSEEGEDGRSIVYYRAQVRTDWSEEQRASTRFGPSSIRPGMTVTADIQTGRRTILQFLLKPVLRAFSGAFLPE